MSRTGYGIIFRDALDAFLTAGGSSNTRFPTMEQVQLAGVSLFNAAAETGHVDIFVGHSWSAGRWSKFLALCLRLVSVWEEWKRWAVTTGAKSLLCGLPHFFEKPSSKRNPGLLLDLKTTLLRTLFGIAVESSHNSDRNTAWCHKTVMASCSNQDCVRPEGTGQQHNPCLHLAKTGSMDQPRFFNLDMAICCAFGAWLIVAATLLGWGGITSLGGSYLALPCLVYFPMTVFFVVFIFGQQLFEGRLPPALWVDKLCIHQTDMDRKAEQIAALPVFVMHSSRMLILWDDTYFERC